MKIFLLKLFSSPVELCLNLALKDRKTLKTVSSLLKVSKYFW